jgi:hypothetical protein
MYLKLFYCSYFARSVVSLNKSLLSFKLSKEFTIAILGESHPPRVTIPFLFECRFWHSPILRIVIKITI